VRFLDPEHRATQRRATTVVVAVAVFGISFGVLAAQSGLSIVKTSALSLLVFSGGSQLAAVGIAAHGTDAAAVVTGLLLASRLAAFSVVATPYVDGPWWRRAFGTQLIVDEPVVLAAEHRDLQRARYAFWFTGIALFVSWNLVTILGAAVGDVLGDPERLGLDSAFTAVFVALLAPRLRDATERRVAVVGAAIALALTPFAPAGVPVLAASAAVLAGGRGRDRDRA
jgi:predicted branched-subunit amino acid permease